MNITSGMVAGDAIPAASASEVRQLLWQLRVTAQQDSFRASLREPPRTVVMDSRSGRDDGESTELVLGSMTSCDITNAIRSVNVVRNDTEESA
jgi:hypothetical protein